MKQLLPLLFTIFFSNSIFGQADLVVLSPDIMSTRTTGITFSCIVHNNGSYIPASTKMGIYLSKDQKWDTSDVFLNYFSVYLIQGYNETTIYDSEFYPADLLPGNYYLLLYADYNHQITESNENNNVNSLYIGALTSTDILKGNQITISPNIVKDILTIDLGDENNKVNIDIYNSLGKIILRNIDIIGKQAINVNTLNTGIYFIKTIYKDSALTMPFIKR
jgi:hypothetical protein